MEEPAPRAAKRLMAPAACLLITGVVGLLLNLATPVIGAAFYDWITDLFRSLAEQSPDFDAEEFERTFAAQREDAVRYTVWTAISLALSAAVLIGSIQMMRGRSWTFSVIAAIVAMIPCLGPCCAIGIPFGIWALVVLFDQDVRASFEPT